MSYRRALHIRSSPPLILEEIQRVETGRIRKVIRAAGAPCENAISIRYCLNGRVYSVVQLPVSFSIRAGTLTIVETGEIASCHSDKERRRVSRLSRETQMRSVSAAVVTPCDSVSMASRSTVNMDARPRLFRSTSLSTWKILHSSPLRDLCSAALANLPPGFRGLLGPSSFLPSH